MERAERILIIIDSEGKMQEKSLAGLENGMIFFGRDPQKNDVVISSRAVSRVHGKFKLEGERLLFADMQSTNGTVLERDGRQKFLRGNEMYEEVQDGDMLRILSGDQKAGGDVLILYTADAGKGTWRKLPVLTSRVSIGRSQENDIVLRHPSVSRFHAAIEKKEGSYILSDLGSANGTLLNGVTLTGSRRLGDRDVIRILNHTLIYAGGKIYYKSSASGISIQVSDICKYVGKGKKILDHVSCEIESNEFVAIIGGSGAGKSTLMNAISGFDKKTEGTVLFNGTDLRSHFDVLKGMIGYVPQEDIIYENLTLRKMLFYTAKLKMPGDTSKAEIEKRIDQVLNMIELKEHQNTLIRKLSGGQKKRASIAVELLADPSVFFLDEPTSGLDPGTEQKLMMTLGKLSKSQGKTIVMVTHTTQSLELCDKVIFMGRGGRLCFCGTTEQARMFFDTEDLVEIYNMISEKPELWAGQFANCMEYQRLPAGKGKMSSRKKRTYPLRQLQVLLCRYMELIKNDWPRLIMLLAQPVLIAFLLSIVAGEKVFEQYEDTKSILFSLSCAGIWIGLFNSIQEICKERAILKREYMANLKLPLYVLSKFSVQTFLGFFQAALMTVVFVLTTGIPEEGIWFENPVWEIFLLVWLTIEASMALGFIISALVRSGDKAMAMAPFVLIVQLLFSGILFELKGMGDVISSVTISKWSVGGLGSIAHLNDLSLRIQEQLPGAVHEAEEIFEATGKHLWQMCGILLGMTLLCALVCTLLLRGLSRDSR